VIPAASSISTRLDTSHSTVPASPRLFRCPQLLRWQRKKDDFREHGFRGRLDYYEKNASMLLWLGGDSITTHIRWPLISLDFEEEEEGEEEEDCVDGECEYCR